MKIKKGFVLRKVADSIVVVPTTDLMKEFNAIIHLNDAGKFIWELLEKQDLELYEIAEKLREEYQIEEDRAKVDAEKFVAQLKSANLLED